MQVIEPSFSILSLQGNIDDKFVESIGRVCYKSENNITESSASKFIKMLTERNHLAMIEHGVITLSVPQKLYTFIKQKNPKFFQMNEYKGIKDKQYIITGNLRAWKEFYEEYKQVINIIQVLSKHSSVFTFTKSQPINKDIKIVNTNMLHNFLQVDHIFVTVKFISNRGFSHELVRHRIASFAQESTRYCNYNKDKFGSQLTLIKPYWWNTSSLFAKIIWSFVSKCSEWGYKFLSKTLPPQAARGILINDLTTEIVITASLKEWVTIFKLRAAKEAHPDMQKLMYPLQKILIDKFPFLKDY